MYGALVRAARLSRGLSQLALADLAGLEQPNLSAIENERRLPTAATLHRLLFACGFELAAVADERVLALPPPDDDLDEPLDEATIEALRAELPVQTRARMLAAALDASEAVLRAR